MSNNPELPGVPSVSSSSPSLPELTKQLKASYNMLDGVQRALFKRVFIWLYRYIQARQLSGIVFNYWGAEAFRLSSSLTTTELSILSFLYLASNRGVDTVRSSVLYDAGICPGVQLSAIQTALCGIQRRGYINRTFRDPASPYLSENINKHKIFIRMTKPGIKLMRDFEYTINYNTMRSSLADVAERGKQGRTLNKKRDKV